MSEAEKRDERPPNTSSGGGGSASKASGSIIRAVAASVRLMWQVDRFFFVASAGIMAVSGALPVVMAHLSADFLGRVAEIAASPNSLAGLPPGMIPLILMIGLIAAIAITLARAGEAIQELYQRKLANHAAMTIGAKAASIDISNYDDPSFHNLLQNASSEATSRPYQIVQSSMQAVAASTTLISTILVIGKWQPWLFPFAILGPAVALAYNSRLARQRVSLVTTNTENERFERYLSGALTGGRSAKEIRLLGAGAFLMHQLRIRTAETYQKYRSFVTRGLWGRILILGLTGLDKPFFFIYLASQAASHRISFAEFVLYAQAIPLFQGGLNAIGQSVTRLMEASLFVQKMHEFMSIRPAVEAENEDRAPAQLDAPHVIEFREVGFCYSANSEQILRDVSFTIDRGEFVALVGGNGSGKSTIVKLLGGLYNPTNGQILLRNADITKLSRRDIRREIAFMLQDFYLFTLSASENIGLGDIGKVDDADAISAAAETSGIAAIIKKWPAGFATPLGRAFTGGKELSGGERQLVAFARIAMKKSGLAVFDEPTSALDARNEDRFMTFLARLRGKGTSILCATHRLSLTQKADKIVVMEKGKVVAVGKHADLAISCPQYAAIVHAHHNKSLPDHGALHSMPVLRGVSSPAP